jgi:phosphatidylglycerol---prolipoprotein diacylglyceryl transferase
MYPTIPIGPLRLQTYGIFLLVAYMAGLWLAARQARRQGMDGDHIYNLGFYALLVGIVAARLGHALAFIEVYRTDPLQLLSLSPGAFLPLPGLLGAVAMAAVYMRRHRLPVAATLDALAPGIVLALAVASVGAFLAGHQPGALSDLPWAVEAFGVRRHPAALYQAAALLGLLALLLWIQHRGAMRPGQLALLALFGYAAMQLFLDPLRAGGLLLGDGWRVTQIVALAVVIASGWLLSRTADDASPATNESHPDA